MGVFTVPAVDLSAFFGGAASALVAWVAIIGVYLCFKIYSYLAAVDRDLDKGPNEDW